MLKYFLIELHVSVLVTPILFSVVRVHHVRVRRRHRLRVCALDLSLEGVVHHVEETLSQVHVSDWVDFFSDELASRQLSELVSPQVLDTLHVPLVDDGYNSLVFVVLDDLFVESDVSLVNEKSLEAWNQNFESFDVPTQQIAINSCFCEC